MSDDRTLQEQCYGECWAAQQRIEELEQELIAVNNNVKFLQKDNQIKAEIIGELMLECKKLAKRLAEERR